MTGAARPGRLPEQRSRMVGRREELARLEALCPRLPLVTVTGVAGVGKTRLAAEAAGALRPAFRDGVWWVPLSGLDDGAMLAHVIADALPLADQSTRPMIEVLGEYLAERELLLVLDTCEHLADACAFAVELLLRAAPGLRVLATSRRPLGMLPEDVLALEPLPVPGPDEEGGTADALVLLAERAAEAVPGFAVAGAGQGALVRLCRRLEGLPLAIELAAARLRDMPVTELTEQLADRFAVLSAADEPGGPASDPPWHHALRTAIGWSHQLCSPAERLLWARLSVFSGSFDADTARRVCGDAHLPGTRIPQLVASLVEKSIVTWTPTAAGDRYTMLDTLRDYGLGWLRRLGDEDACRRRHRDHYRALARRADAAWMGADQFTWYDRITGERDNLRAALEACLSEPADHAALEMAGDLWFLWYGCGFAKEGRLYLDRALAADTRTGPARLKALWASGLVLVGLGDADGCAARSEECLAAAEELGGDDALALALTVSLVSTAVRGDLAGMTATADRILAVPDDRLAPATLLALQAHTHVAVYSGEPGQALAHLDRLRELCDRHGEKWMRAFGDYFRAQAELGLGRPAQARHHARASLRVKHRMHDRMGSGLALDVLAAATGADGEHGSAAYLLGLARQVWETLGVPDLGQPQWTALRRDCEERARAALGDDGFDAAYRSGRTVELDTGIARALSGPSAGAGVPRPAG